MAEAVTRRVNIFVNSADAEKSIAQIRREAAKLNRQITRELTPGTKEYYDAVERLGELRGTIRNHNAAVRDASRAWDSADQSATRAVGSIGGVSKALGGIPGVGAAAGFAMGLLTDNLVEGAVAMFKMGAEMEVLGRKAQTVFGEALPIVTAQAEANAHAMGLTVGAYTDAATAIGDLLIPMGFQREEAATISSELVNLSGALSEWTGGQVSAAEVTDILGKAMLGEREQLKGLGIAISESDVKARLAEKGLSNLTGEMLKQAQAATTLELITEKSADAQAAYAQNADTLVRKQAELAARFGEVKEVIATALTPVFHRLLAAMTPSIEAMTTAIGLFAKGEKDVSGFSAEVQQAYNWLTNLVGGFEMASDAGTWYFSNVLTPLWEVITGFIVPAFRLVTGLLQSAGIMSEESGEKFNVFKLVLQALTLPIRTLTFTLGTIQTVVTDFVLPAIGRMIEDFERVTNAVVGFANTIASIGGFEKKFTEVDFSGFAEAFKTAGGEAGKGFADEATKEIQKTTATPPPTTGGTPGGRTPTPSAVGDPKEAERKAKEVARIEEQAARERIKRMEALAAAIDKINREEYLNSLSEKQRLIALEREKYEALIKEATELKGAQSEEVAALTHLLESRILEIENDFAARRQQADEERHLEKLERMQAQLDEEADLLGSIEGENFEARMERLQEEYERLLEQAQEQGLNTQEVEANFRQEKERLEKEHADRLLENSRKLAEGERKLQDARIKNFAAAADALSQIAGDNSKLQKALLVFQKGIAIAEIIINAQREIAAISAQYALIPGGQAIAAGLIAATKVRAGIGIATIAATTIADLQKKDGGYVNVTGPDDGKRYNARYNPRPSAGFLPPGPQLLLANERGAEYFVPHHLLRHPVVADSVGIIESIRAGRQYQEGGFALPVNTVAASPTAAAADAARLADVLELLTEQLAGGIPVVIGEDDARNIQNLIAEVNRKDGLG